MDKQKIESLCLQIIQAGNAMTVSGEVNLLQLIGMIRSTRSILVELGKPEEEEHDGR